MGLEYGRTDPFKPGAGGGTVPLAFSTATTSAVQAPATSAKSEGSDQVKFDVFGSVDAWLGWGTSSAAALAAAATGPLTSTSTGTAVPNLMALRAGSIQIYSFPPGTWFAAVGTATGGFIAIQPGAGA